MSWIKNTILNSALVLVSLTIGLVLFEIFLKIDNKYKPVERINVEIYGNSYRFLKSDSTASPLEINKNDREFLVLGDSFTEGVVCAKDDANFRSHLSKIHNSELKVVNLGVGGKNNADYVDFLDYFHISEGDVAIVTLYDNDIHLSKNNCEQIIRQAENHDVYVPNFCSVDESFVDKSNKSLLQKINNNIKKFKTVQLLKESLAQIPSLQKYFYRNEFRNVWNEFDSEENKWLISTLRVMHQQMISSQGSVIFTYYPNTNNISENDQRHEIWKRFISHVKMNEGIEILDPYPYFIENAPQKGMVWSLTDKHPNCAAHKIMAEFLGNHHVIKDKWSANFSK